MTSNSNSNDIQSITITVTIHQGRGLIAKDKSLFGKKSSSDPFVKVSFLNHCYGQTSVRMKTLAPIWNESVKIHITDKQRIHQALQTQTASLLKLSIWDHDKMSKPDSMGIINISFLELFHANTPNSTDGITKRFYPVQPGSSGTAEYCPKATGEVEVSIAISAARTLELVPGNVHPLRGHTKLMVGTSWDCEQQRNIDLDVSCVALSTSGEVLPKDSVYFGNLRNSNGSVYHSGDERTGISTGYDEVLNCDLVQIPSNIVAMYFILSVVNDNKTFDGIKSSRVEIIDQTTGKPVCQFNPSTVLGRYTSLFLARLNRRSGNDWVLSPMFDGHESARDFGTLIPHIKSYSRDIIPNIHVNPNEKMALMHKDGVIRISDYYCPPQPSMVKTTDSGVPTHDRIPSMVTFGLAWDVTNGQNIDLDASAICLDGDLNEVEIVSFRKLQSTDGSIIHGGDEREGDAIGDDEKINFRLKTMNRKVKFVGIVINSYSGQELDDVAAASCHLFDSETNKDIARYSLTNAKELDKRTGLIMACLFRGDYGDGSNTDETEWYMQIMSHPCNGLVASALVDDLQLLLVQKPPKPAPRIIVEDETDECEIDLSMPVRVQHREDEEIVVLPYNDLKQYVSNQPK